MKYYKPHRGIGRIKIGRYYSILRYYNGDNVYHMAIPYALYFSDIFRFYMYPLYISKRKAEKVVEKKNMEWQ